MGGINSGRVGVVWGREKPIAEDSSILDISTLQKTGALIDGASGLYHHEDNTLSYRTIGDTLIVAYTTRGQNVLEYIELSSIALNWHNGTSRRCLLCPDCKRRCYKLYITTKLLRPRCRYCNSLVYEAQTHHHGSLIYRYWQSIKEERRFEAMWLARNAAKKEQARERHRKATKSNAS